MASTHTANPPSTRPTLGRLVLLGAGVGMIASLAMAMYAMIASLAKDTGFLTPLYHIASLLTSDESLMASMEAAADGSSFHLVLGPALAGALIHMMTGGMYGVVFALVVRRLSSSEMVLTAAGAVYGVVVFAMSAFIALPLAAAVFGSGDQISNMAEMAGWGTFLVEHLFFGAVLGSLLATRLGSSRNRA